MSNLLCNRLAGWSEAFDGRPLTTHRLGKMLAGFVGRAKQWRAGADGKSGVQFRGYLRADVAAALARYNPRDALLQARSEEGGREAFLAGPRRERELSPVELADRDFRDRA